MLTTPPLSGKLLILGIGAQKSGTHWLYHYLSGHPQCAMSPQKELHFWDEMFRPDLCGHFTAKFAERLPCIKDAARAEALKERIQMRNAGDYLDFFAKRIRPEVLAFGEITPSYSLLPRAGFEELKALHDRVKLILMLRDPVTRFWSGVCHQARRRNCAPDFDQAINDPHHVERSRYDLMLERLDGVFTDRNLMILFYETFFGQRDISALCRFIGIDGSHPTDFDKMINAGSNMPLSEGNQRQAREVLSPVYDYCARRFQSDIPATWMTSF